MKTLFKKAKNSSNVVRPIIDETKDDINLDKFEKDWAKLMYQLINRVSKSWIITVLIFNLGEYFVYLNLIFKLFA